MSTEIIVNQDNKPIYPIIISDGWGELNPILQQGRFTERKICLVTDSNVESFYAKQVIDLLKQQGITCIQYTFLAGEENKTLDTVRALYKVLIENHFERNDCLIALGGGVVGDLTGYTAATYLRGIDFIQLPTSLLAMVDSSIGGKTGVDFDGYKNMVGAFKQPSAVYMNLSVLHTLPQVQLSAGMGEVIKYGLISNHEFYQYLQQHVEEILHLDYAAIEHIVYQSCIEKKKVVEADPTEKGVRAILNFGHTIGHAIEKESDFSLYHGQCVALGMLTAVQISIQKGALDVKDLDTLRDILTAYHLPINLSKSLLDKWSDIMELTRSDKKMTQGRIKFVLLESVGKAYIDNNIDITDMNATKIVLCKNGETSEREE